MRPAQAVALDLQISVGEYFRRVREGELPALHKQPPYSTQHQRREQIIQAAIAIIDEQGIQNLSLSEIENKTGMRRGQLTYYFHTKESILLAVFDRLLQMMLQAVEGAEGCLDWATMSGWERFQQLFTVVMLRPPLIPQ